MSAILFIIQRPLSPKQAGQSRRNRGISNTGTNRQRWDAPLETIVALAKENPVEFGAEQGAEGCDV